jgi:hypothetical protein
VVNKVVFATFINNKGQKRAREKAKGSTFTARQNPSPAITELV